MLKILFDDGNVYGILDMRLVERVMVFFEVVFWLLREL